ncbi:hypothetical protein Ciccas_001926 [Cichlidogyrus casuarinus]|uniref:Mediator of RNA polymerase II transcription subunit 13 n=1 Tax=Cichlidogyrus casuarinus TaxID=1844966 RepID=A0ABD2QIP3_9PLAT
MTESEQISSLLNWLESVQQKTQTDKANLPMLQQQEEALVREILNKMGTHLFSGNGHTLPLGVPDPQLIEPPGGLMIQPIAMGYYMSTAPAHTLPWWFWSSCPHTQWQNPVCLKSALHLKCSLVVADEASGAGLGHISSEQKGTPVLGHPLDSVTTCDVLRFIMESFNALSWLTMDPVTNDRTSCLPLHIYHLSKMCHLTQHFS